MAGRNATVTDIIAAHIGITDDLQKVSISILQNGKQLAWIEMDGEQCDHFLKQVTKYRELLKPWKT
jgi:hypothetical protein